MAASAAIDNICRICFAPANVKAIEKQANGISMEGLHEDGTIHNWLRYYSLRHVSLRKQGKPIIVTCPKCHKKGKVYDFHSAKEPRWKVKYYITHKKPKDIKERRCYITDQKQRKALLIKLGRYIVNNNTK